MASEKCNPKNFFHENGKNLLFGQCWERQAKRIERLDGKNYRVIL